MNFLNLINWLKSLFKNLIYFFPLFFLLILFKGCELIDEEHCLYETNESRIWTPGNNPAGAEEGAGDSFWFINFGFDRSYGFNRLFKIENSCPFGVIEFKVNIVEKPFIKKPPYYFLQIYKIMDLKGKKYSVYKTSRDFNRKTDTELYVNYTLELDGLLLDGPSEYGAVAYASFYKSDFPGLLEAEEWAKNNIVKVEYKATFIRY